MANKRQFKLWAFGDAHVATDLKQGRKSLAGAIEQSEGGGQPFDWDIAIDVGDMSGKQEPPSDEEGPDIIEQFGALKKTPPRGYL